MSQKTPSLYEILTGNFTGDLPLEVVNEEDQVILSVLDNIQRILNARAGTISHLPDYGLPDQNSARHAGYSPRADRYAGRCPAQV
jgi:type VI secretion system protein